MKLGPDFDSSEALGGSGYSAWSTVPAEYRYNFTRLVSTVLQPLRNYVREPLIILNTGGGLRTPAANTGASSSQHLVGKAADFYFRQDANHLQDMFDLLDAWQHRGRIPRGGLALYDGPERRQNDKKRMFIHVDVRGTLARWATEGGSRNP